MEENIHTDFKLAVKNYITIGDEITEIQEVVKEKRKKIKKLSEFILAYMQDNEKEICNIGEHGTLCIKRNKRKKTINRDDCFNILNEYYKDEKQASDASNIIFEKQEVKTSVTLFRSKTVLP